MKKFDEVSQQLTNLYAATMGREPDQPLTADFVLKKAAIMHTLGRSLRSPRGEGKITLGRHSGAFVDSPEISEEELQELKDFTT